MNRNYRWLVAAMIMFCASADAKPCRSVDQCIEQIPQIEGQLPLDGRLDASLRTKLQSFGRQALNPLAKLSAETNPNRRKVADSLIAKMSDLKPSDFDVVYQVIQNNIRLDGNGGQSYGALGYVGGEKSARFLIAELQRVHSALPPIATGLSRMGRQGLPYLIESLKCQKDCTWEKYAGYKALFAQFEPWLKNGDDTIAKQLFALVTDETVHSWAAKSTALSITGYATDSVEISKRIFALAESRYDSPYLMPAMSALQNMHNHWAADTLIGRLTEGKPSSLLYNNKQSVYMKLSQLGPAAYSIGPTIVKRLDSASWQERVDATLTLGYIGYTPAIKTLRKRTEDKMDWLQVYAAVKALYILQDRASLPWLRRVAQNHWYQPLREYAAKAAQDVDAQVAYRQQDAPYYFDPEFKDYKPWADQHSGCQYSGDPQVDEAPREPADIESLQYRDPRCFENDYDDSDNYCSSDDSLLEPFETMFYHNIWLGGSNIGEWGGELVAFPPKKEPKVLLSENVDSLFSIGDRAFMTAGIAHLSVNEGLLYEISIQGDQFDVWPIYRLPAVPYGTQKRSSDSVVISTSAGELVFSPEHGFSSVPCKGN